jgi:hypothetical protein
MPFLGMLIIAMQIGFAIHAVRTGRDTFWIYIIAFIPLLGCAVYFFTQMLPDLQTSRSVRQAGNHLLKAIDPARELRKRQDELALADTVDNRLKLAGECVEAGFYTDAIPLLERCLNNGHTEPDIMLKLAQAQFGAKQYSETIQTLDHLIAEHPSFRSDDGHLLYARSLEAVGRDADALAEYAVLANTYPGEEGRMRYAQVLLKTGAKAQAKMVLNEILLRAKRAPSYYKRKEQAWIKQAEQALKGLSEQA